MADVIHQEQVRAERLLEAQAMAEQLFGALDERGLIAPGVGECAASRAIRDLADDLFGLDPAGGHHTSWHKPVVRAGPNTLLPYGQSAPDRVIGADDIVFCDVGPVVANWQADVGRTYVVGTDPVKERLRDALPVLWAAGHRFYDGHPWVTGEQLHAHLSGLAAQAGWELGGSHAGHLVGAGPNGDSDAGAQPADGYIGPGNGLPMRRLDAAGRPCHWVLEVHLVDRSRQIGGFYEELLDLRPH